MNKGKTMPKAIQNEVEVASTISDTMGNEITPRTNINMEQGFWPP